MFHCTRADCNGQKPVIDLKSVRWCHEQLDGFDTFSTTSKRRDYGHTLEFSVSKSCAMVLCSIFKRAHLS